MREEKFPRRDGAERNIFWTRRLASELIMWCRPVLAALYA